MRSPSGKSIIKLDTDVQLNVSGSVEDYFGVKKDKFKFHSTVQNENIQSIVQKSVCTILETLINHIPQKSP